MAIIRLSRQRSALDMDSFQLTTHRIQISTSISGLSEHQDKQLKSFIQRFLWERAVGCHIERVRHSVDDGATTTHILFEAESGLACSSKKDLITAVAQKFPHVALPPDDNDHWIVRPSTEILTAAKIVPTSTEIRRDDSSGALPLSMPLAESNLDAISLSSSIMRAIVSFPGVNLLSRVLQATGKLRKIDVFLHYGSRFVSLDVTTMNWEMVKEEARKQLDIPLTVRAFWIYVDGQWGTIANSESFQDGSHYYLTAETDPDPTSPPMSPNLSVPASPATSFGSMEDFYAALRARGSNEAQISKIRNVFEEQEIIVAVLDRLTDENLKEAGLFQVGLRKAVLSVLGK